MNYRKLTITLTVLASIIAAGLLIRFPLHGEAPFLIEPENGKDVIVSDTGAADQTLRETRPDRRKGRPDRGSGKPRD